MLVTHPRSPIINCSGFICRLITLGFDVLLGLASLCSYRFIRPAKFLMGFADLFLVVAVVLIPIGYNRLGDTCDDTHNSCGLACTGQGSFGFFTLCAPWSIGTSMYLLIVGVILLFVASIVSSCIRSKTKYCTLQGNRSVAQCYVGRARSVCYLNEEHLRV